MSVARRLLPLAATAAATLAVAAPALLAAPPSGAPLAGAPPWAVGPAGGIVRPHDDMGAARSSMGSGAVKLLSYHNGPVMTAGAVVTPIYWGPRWADTTFAGDKQAGLSRLYGGLGGSTYQATNTEYTQTGGAKVSSAVSLGLGGATPAWLSDTSATVSGAPSTSTVAGVVARALQTANIAPRADGYYPVYSDQPRGSAGYCAWHSYGTLTSAGVTARVQFAFFFNLDGDAGCNPPASSGHSQGLSALANVSGHELSEAVTDPNINAWYDSSGAENSDKCAWTFDRRGVTVGAEAWFIQGNWSNAAYGANRGYTDTAGRIDRGCISS